MHFANNWNGMIFPQSGQKSSKQRGKCSIKRGRGTLNPSEGQGTNPGDHRQ